MAGVSGDALDWALALARAPGERLVLRQRPLPEGIDALLQIAAGHRGEALSGAVARSGETEQDLVEAVRFYLREVLFHSSADAYRILGLERGASADQVKGHHRWLQQWLHPDRHTSDWDAIFAGRVNAAWNQLRTQERRTAYDAERVVERAPTAIPISPVMAGWGNPLPPPQTPGQRWRRRVPVLALMVACGGLGVMALRDLARDEALLASGISDREPSARDVQMQREDALPAPLENLRTAKRARPSFATIPVAKPVVPRPTPSAITRRAPVDPVAPMETAAITAAALPKIDAPVRRIAKESRSDAGSVVAESPRPPATKPIIVPSPPLPATKPIIVASPPQPVPAAKPVIAAAPQPVPTAKPLVAAPPQPVPAAKPVIAASRPQPVQTDKVAIASASPRPVQAAKLVKADPPRVAPEAVPAVVPRVAPTLPAAVSQGAPKPQTTAQENAPVSAERVRQAQRAGDRLIAFMGRPGASTPPIWDSPATQKGALQLRDAMLADGRPLPAQADWRVGESEARMRVAIRHVDGRQGHLNAVLVWREERWLVRRLSMERDW